jgi:hypothetical protein
MGKPQEKRKSTNPESDSGFVDRIRREGFSFPLNRT